MKDGLMLVERIVIESISRKEKNIYELVNDTNLDQEILLNIIPNLLMRNLINYHRGIYSIDKESSMKWLETINQKNNIKEEVKELFTSLVNEYFVQNKITSSQLKVQKVWLTSDEEMILKSHLATIESFFREVKNDRKINPIREKTFEQKVLIWGFSNYSDLVHGVLKAV